MVSIRRQLMGLGFIAGSSVMAMGAAHAMTGQTNINVDGGPLGQLEMSGGMAGYGYALTNHQTGEHPYGTRTSALFLQLQKTTGIVQFTVNAGSDNGAGITPGATPTSADANFPKNQSPNKKAATSFINKAYITIAPPDAPVTVSAGILGGLEGYESGTEWNNASLFTSAINAVQTGNQIGVNAVVTEGPASLTVQFGDVNGNRVFNTVELLGNYSFNSNNTLSIYSTISAAHVSVGTTAGGINSAKAYSSNDKMFGAYYSWTKGNLNLVPEVQYVYAKPNGKAGITKFSSNLGIALFSDYSFANTPYSLGAWAAWDKAIGNGFVVVGKNEETVTFAVSPTWQYKYLFARVNGAVVHLLNNKVGNGTKVGFGTSGGKETQFIAAVDTGFVF